MVITRFAPSPTGDPHIGNIRSALFAYLFAKANSGKFLLRIEDTDRERHDEGSIGSIQEALEWLNILPENLEEPMVQSTRLQIYKKAALQLVEEGKAYVCNCSKERLEEVRNIARASGRPPGYDGHCRDLGLPFGDDSVIRMKIPKDEKIVIEDLVRGTVEFDTSSIDDQVILKSDGYPTYHLAHIIDDHEMQITHVIRAEEWLPSTPKHVILNQMLGFTPPKYAHLPIILGSGRGKLSKRDGAVGILEYKKTGYLAEAVINFMVLLGWNPKTEEEFFTLSELEEKFDISQVNKAPAVFNVEKLDFFNKYYLHRIAATDLEKLLPEEVISKIPAEVRTKVIDMAKERMTTLNDFTEAVRFVTDEVMLDKDKLVFRKSTPEQTAQALSAVAVKLENTDWNKEAIKAALEEVASGGFSNGDVFWPTRYALSGAEKSPPPEELAEVLGKEKTLTRIGAAINILNN